MESLGSEIDRLREEREEADAAARRRVDLLESRLHDAEIRCGVGRGTPASPEGVEPAAVPPRDPDAIPAWLDDLLSTNGARVVPLGPQAPAPGATGFAVWSPARGIVVVSASNLPRGDGDALYRVRVTLSDDSTVWVGDVPASDRGTLVVTVAIPEPAARRITGIELYRDPPGAPALTARVRP
jgi:hypothetical protein